MKQVKHNLTSDQQSDVDHLMSLFTNVVASGTFEDDESVSKNISDFQFTLESVIASPSQGTQKPD